jgi:hypothetical protein
MSKAAVNNIMNRRSKIETANKTLKKEFIQSLEEAGATVTQPAENLFRPTQVNGVDVTIESQSTGGYSPYPRHGLNIRIRPNYGTGVKAQTYKLEGDADDKTIDKKVKQVLKRIEMCIEAEKSYRESVDRKERERLEHEKLVAKLNERAEKVGLKVSAFGRHGSLSPSIHVEGQSEVEALLTTVERGTWRSS